MRLKDLVYINSSTLPEDTNSSYCFNYIDISSVSGEGGISMDTCYNFGEAPSRARRIVKKGDVLISTVRTYLRAIAAIDFDAKDIVASTGFAVCSPKKNIASKYLSYAVRNNLVIADICKESTGVSYPAIPAARLSSIEIPFCEIAEQRAIADYLDKKTVEIDTQISLLENKQKAYEKLKCSLIDKVVTCGLNPDVELKDSGIDWIGEIPVHWEVKRLKSIFSECKEISSTGNEDLLSVSEYYGVARRLDVMDEDEYDTRADSLVGYKICKKDDLVINIMLAWKRGLGFSDYDGIVSPAYAVYRGKNIVPHYYHYLLRTNKYIAEFKRNSKGIIDSRLRLYSDRFFAINTIVPPLEEQLAVADYLDKKTAEIDECISLTDKKIKAYKRLKQSLIDEVVTGKRKI